MNGRKFQFQGIYFRPNHSKSINTYVDALFAGDLTPNSGNDPISVMTQTGYVVEYAGCPIIWLGYFQTKITLSTTESEYVALSQSMQDLLPLMTFLLELKS